MDEFFSKEIFVKIEDFAQRREDAIITLYNFMKLPFVKQSLIVVQRMNGSRLRRDDDAMKN